MWRSRGAAIAALVLIAVGLLFASSLKREDAARHNDREAALRGQLAQMRAAIAAFHAENGRYPRDLESLVPKYLPSIPVDPLTGSSQTWSLTTEHQVQPGNDFATSTAAPSEAYVIDVRSGAGKPYSDY